MWLDIKGRDEFCFNLFEMRKALPEEQLGFFDLVNEVFHLMEMILADAHRSQMLSILVDACNFH
jgi:hypothetical protein